MQEIIQQTTWIEWLGVFLSILQVILAQQNKAINYLFGIGGIILSLVVMFNAGLYAEFTLYIYYLIMSIYGWLYWKLGKTHQETPISYADKADWLKISGIVIFSFFSFYFMLSRFTTSDVPIWDASVSAFACAGMWLLAKRKIENWILLNMSNIIAIPLMVHKSLHLYAVLYIILFCVAISGYYNWKRIFKKTKEF
ncbi:nicotinamide riboside transporter PnuC [Elizabethkingia argentiflava]|uniref:Nicotinamide riboside transporter PnuC n=1 Tax=Elizabethkingia argenteiflava TaxID=2681556 RepID=A0A845PT05_9FLAO|nr:nicotinamide riboside transporter PnuC [Elizabethkingia argenteiflava]NAW50056.1 nicotinamide riboside transporter PnuC [Elizabethkingia argenteiflava]